MQMELTIAHYFPQLDSFWGSTEGDLRRFFADLHADSNFVPAINDKIRDVPDFDGKQFKLASEMRVYRCLLYLAARVIRPEHFVETGVQNGMSSAFILLALKHNGRGQLYSVDLPPIEQRILDQGTIRCRKTRHLAGSFRMTCALVTSCCSGPQNSCYPSCWLILAASTSSCTTAITATHISCSRLVSP